MPFRHCQSKSSLHQQIGRNGLHANIYLNNYESYCGQWLNNEKYGYGKLINHRNKSFYEGEFFQNKKHGYGRLTICVNKKFMQRYYIGQWKNDQMNGHGTLYLNENEYYEGEFVDNKRSGWGRMYYENGNMYEGEWSNNKRHGFGLFFINGNHYEGNWFDDKKHGYGQYYFEKEKYLFKGLWLNDMFKSSEFTQLLNREHKTSASQKI